MSAMTALAARVRAFVAAPAVTAPKDALPPDVLRTFEYLWQELRDERSQQVSRLAHMASCAAATIGFESVLLALITKVDAPLGWRIASSALLAVSMCFLFWCLLGTPRKGDDEWQVSSRGSLAVVDPDEISRYETGPSGEMLLQLYVNERSMVQRNLDWLLDPKRRSLTRGAYLFVFGLVALGAGEIQHLAGG